VLQLTKSRSAKSRGEKSEPLDPGTGGPLDQGLIARIAHSEVRRLRGPLLDIRSHEVPRAEAQVRNTWQNHKVGPAWLTGGHALPGERSQCSVDFSRLGDSRSKSTGAQPFDSRRCE
jgi:hypothetical protein